MLRQPLLVACAALVAVVSACGPTDREARERARDTGYRGMLLPEPWDVPDFTLTDTRGQPFDFREETRSGLTLLFFGFTNCPDVCPVHMANLAAVLERLPGQQRRKVRVVFVSTDPRRDTAARIRSWLDRWDPSFIGLRGELEEVNRIQAALNLPPAVRQARDGSAPARTDSTYLVGHASQVLAISPDGRVRAVYPFGTRQADWLHDLPKLLEAFTEPAETRSARG